MNKKNLKKLLINVLDEEASPEEKLLLEKKCRKLPWLAEEKESFKKLISLLRQSETISSPMGFTEKVMAQIEKKPARNERRIPKWIRSPLDVHLNWGWKWAMAFTLVFLIWGGMSWQNLQMQKLSTQVIQLEQNMLNIKNQPVPTRFFFFHPKAQSLHLVGSFNNWQPAEESRMFSMSGDGIWSVSLLLKPGQYEYMFLVDGKEWATDPAAADFHSDGFGNTNSVVKVSREMQI